jgi:hypothetical protein
LGGFMIHAFRCCYERIIVWRLSNYNFKMETTWSAIFFFHKHLQDETIQEHISSCTIFIEITARGMKMSIIFFESLENVKSEA